jgi:hypothetical protein
MRRRAGVYGFFFKSHKRIRCCNHGRAQPAVCKTGIYISVRMIDEKCMMSLHIIISNQPIHFQHLFVPFKTRTQIIKKNLDLFILHTFLSSNLKCIIIYMFNLKIFFISLCISPCKMHMHGGLSSALPNIFLSNHHQIRFIVLLEPAVHMHVPVALLKSSKITPEIQVRTAIPFFTDIQSR